MKIVVKMTIELPVEVPDNDTDLDFWLNESSLCLNSLLPPNEYHQCLCPLVIEPVSWRMAKVEDGWHFEGNQLWQSSEAKPKEGVDC